MFDGPKYIPPVPIPESAQVQYVKHYSQPPDYFLMAVRILREISEHIQPDGVYGPRVVHILVEDLESRLLGVSENDRDMAFKKASKELAVDMLTVVKKTIMQREVCEKIIKVVCKEIEAENNRLLKQFADFKKYHGYPDGLTFQMDSDFDEFMGLSQKSLLSYALYQFFTMNALKLEGEDVPSDTEQE
jgi:hypothetical protein